jgi:hypothetical protein
MNPIEIDPRLRIIFTRGCDISGVEPSGSEGCSKKLMEKIM